MEKIVIAILLGTVREGRQSERAAKWVVDFGRQLPDVEIILVDPRELHLPGDGNKSPEAHDPSYTDITARADAFFIVSPEYNHSFPGSLKRVIDSEFDNYRHKPVAIAGVSDGQWGGARMAEALLPVLRTVGLVVIPRTVYFPKVQDIFDEQGVIKPDHEAAYAKSVGGAFEELLWFARALKAARTK